MRVILCGRLRQRSFGTGTGEMRTLTEVEVEEIGLSLRYATAAVGYVAGGNSQQNPAGSILESDEPPPSPNWALGRAGRLVRGQSGEAGPGSGVMGVGRVRGVGSGWGAAVMTAWFPAGWPGRRAGPRSLPRRWRR
jgi:hypothetical protein